MALEGQIVIDLNIERTRVESVGVRSLRRIDACRALVGKPVEEALQAIPFLFSVCAEAQGAAAAGACEDALGIPVADGARAARQLRVMAEAIDSHAVAVALRWPERMGVPVPLEGLRRVRRCTGRLRAEVSARDLPNLAEVTWAAHEVELHLQELLGEPLPRGLGDLDRWQAGGGPVQRVAAELRSPELEGFGRSSVPLLPLVSPSWFQEQMAGNPFFEREPLYDGRPAEVGSLARCRDATLVKELLAVHGNGLLTRFMARLVDLSALGAQVESLAQDLHGGSGRAAAGRSSGRGAAVVATARGLLAHLVTIEDDQVVDWRVVAPTEWNFHPAGPLAAGLLGAPAQGLQLKAALLVGALDPCVGFDLRITGALDA